MAFSETERQAFFDRGIVRIVRAFSEADAAGMLEKIWNLIEDKSGQRPNDPATWTERQPTGFQSLTRSHAFNSIACPAVIDALNDLLGPGAWNSTKAWGAPLVTFPEAGRTWDVPRKQWHLDFPARGTVHEFPGVRVLAFFAPVGALGGGTVVAAGSHRLVERLVARGQAQGGHSATVRDLLAASYPWFRDLWSDAAAERDRGARFLGKGECVDGVEIRMEELTGVAGDVVLMHPWTFHAPAPNCGAKPRIMVGHSVYRNTARHLN